MILMIASGQTKTNAANAALFDFLGGALFDCWLAQVRTRKLQRTNIAMIPTRNFLIMIAIIYAANQKEITHGHCSVAGAAGSKTRKRS